MERVLQLLAEYQWWLYGLLLVFLLFYLRRAIVARRASLRSIFTLEQEQTHARYGHSVMLAALLMFLMAAVFGLTRVVLPALTATPEPAPTPTTGPLLAPTLTATPPPPTITPTPTATLERPTLPARPSPSPEVVQTPAPQVRPPACPDPNVRITSPGVGQVVQGNVAVRGTASIDNFQYYKVEVGPGASPRDDQWTVVGDLQRSPVSGGLLATFHAGAYQPGIYTLRLVVVDVTGNYPPPCSVTISVQR
jgi:hypothetical protein